MPVKQLAIVSIVSLIVGQAGLAAAAVGPMDETAVRTAWALYNQQKYVASADAFEVLIRTSTPNARLYYYAALANRNSNRIARAKQLCQYIIANFANSTEASYAQKLFPDAASQTAGASGGLPPALKGKNLNDLLQTEEGRKLLKEALAKQGNSTAAPSIVASSVTPIKSKSGAQRQGDRAFAAEVIAKDGAGGIDQFGYSPNCWFECSMAALAMLPRGQALIAGMIRQLGSQDTYMVRFPGDGTEYTINKQKMDECGVRDKALWATLIHCAQVMKFRTNRVGSIEAGLGTMTGKTTEKLHARTTTEGVLSAFIGDAIKSGNPIVCQSADDFGSLPELVEADHAYTITDFDPSSGMLTLRNPHGSNSRRFRLHMDPQHQKFEQLNDGEFRMHISLFMRYFNLVARSSF
jgi:hypothetical protein